MDQKYAMHTALTVNDAAEMARQITNTGYQSDNGRKTIINAGNHGARKETPVVAQKEDGTLAVLLTLHKMFI